MKKLRRRLITLLAVLALLAGLVYGLIPALLAPVEDFPQGPGGAMAYASLSQQVRAQYAAFWGGKNVELVLTEPEFSGVVSSVLLTGQRAESPIRKVRATLTPGAIGVDAVVRLEQAPGPERFHGPFGLRLTLAPALVDGTVRFHIAQAKVGRLPLPPRVIALIGNRIPGFNATEATFDLPLAGWLSTQLGHEVRILGLAAESGKLRMTVSLD